jgi:hypothetical protein
MIEKQEVMKRTNSPTLMLQVNQQRHYSAGPSGRSVSGVGPDHLDAETVGSNPVWGMAVCPCLFIIIHLSIYHWRYVV